MKSLKIHNRLQRKRRIRARILDTSARPRLSIHRSNTRVTAQVIDDASGKTLAAASSTEAKAKHTVDGAKQVGMLIAKKAKDAGITAVVFDRNAYRYHGRVKALAEGAREGGLQF
jgi:large subunit ribosomal protein L18